MVLILVLLGIAACAFPFWVLVRISQLSNEIKMLKRQIQPTQIKQPQTAPLAVSQTTTSAEQADPAPTRTPVQSQPQFAPAATQTPLYSEPLPEVSMDWLTEDIFMKIGALLLLIAFGWFVSYAFMNNWIGPVGRISLGLLAGVAIMGVGTWRIKNYRHQGAVFLILGSGVVLLTIYAARELYDFLTPGLSLLVMFLAVAYVATVSVLYHYEKLALAGLAMAAIAPLLTNTPDPDVAGLMTYLLVVVLGTIWVVRITGSHILTLAAIVMMLLYSLPFVVGSVSAAEQTLALWFAFIFVTIFFAANTISIIKTQSDSARRVQIYSALMTGLYLVLWIGAVMPEQLQSLAYVSWMLVFSFGSFLVYTQTTSRTPFFIYSAVTIGLLFAATATELSGPALTLAFTAEVTVIALLARQLLTKNLSENIVWLFVLPVALSLESFTASTWQTGFIHSDFFTLVAVGGALGLVGTIYLQTRLASEVKNKYAEIMLGLAFFYTLALVWLVLHAVLLDDIATTLSLIVYTILGLIFYINGRRQTNYSWQVWGGVLLGGVVLRLLLIDVWQMDLVGRIITFFIIGVLLISTAFISKQTKVSKTLE